MMPYTTPVIDRAQSDIIALNSKAYMNVADWQRIHENARLASELAAIELDTPIAFYSANSANVQNLPSIDELNNLTGNIERLRLAVAAESISGTEIEIKDDWGAGVSYPSPTIEDANLWESTIDAIWTHFGGDALDTCPTLGDNLTINDGVDYIVIDCIDLNGYTITINGSGRLIIL